IDMPVGHENIRPTIEVVIEEETAETQSKQGRAANFRLRRFIDEEAFAFVVVERDSLVREVCDQNAWVSGMIVIRSVDAHASARDAVFTESNAGHHTFFRESSVAVVVVELVGLRVIGEEKIRPTVVIVVEQRDAHRFGRWLAESCLLRYILERSIAAVVPQPGGCAFVRFRRAIRLALAIERTVQIVFHGPLNVVSDDQIEAPVFVVVDPRSTRAQLLGPGEDGLLRYVGERAIAVVVEEPALPECADEQIVM